MLALVRLMTALLTAYLLLVVPMAIHAETPVATKAPSALGLQWLNQLGGSVNAFTVEGDTLYVNVAGQIRVLDISNPATPQLVGETPATIAILGSNLVWGNDHLYTGNEIIDVRDPQNPIVGRQFYAQEMRVEGNRLYSYAYAAQSNCYVSAYDITNPAQPQRLAETLFPGSEGYCTDLADVEGNFMVLNIVPSRLFTTPYVVLLDVSDPATPQTLSTIPIDVSSDGLRIQDAEIVGDYLYLSLSSFGGNSDYRLYIYDIRDRTAPTLLSARSESAGTLYQNGNRLYVHTNPFATEEEGQVAILDISTPDNPVLLSRYGLPPRGIYHFDVQADYEYRLDEGTVQIRDLRDTNMPPVLVGEYRGWRATAGTSRAGYVYVTDSSVVHDDATLRVFDANDPQNPELVGSLTTEGTTDNDQVALEGETLYWASLTGLRIIDVSTPTSPTLLYQGEITRPVSIVAAEELLYTVSQGGQSVPVLMVLDVSDPTTPTIRSILELPDLAQSPLLLKDNTLYIGTLSGGVMVDVANPDAPAVSGTLGSGTWADGEVEGNTLYIIEHWTEILTLYDVTDAQNPQVISTFTLPTYYYRPADMEVENGTAYIQYYNGAFEVLDVSDPQAIRAGARYYPPRLYASGFHAEGDSLYVWGDWSGLGFLEKSNVFQTFLPQVGRNDTPQ